MTKEKCFIGYFEKSPLNEDLLSTCKELFCESPYNFDLVGLINSSITEVTEREAILDSIKEAAYGVYDISYQKDENGNWHIPGDILIKIGIAIASNQKILLVRDSRKKIFRLPEILQGIDLPIIEFSGGKTLRDGLQREFHKVFSATEKDQSYQQCSFIRKSCMYTEMHPRLFHVGYQEIKTIIVDGNDGKEDFRHTLERVLRRQNKIQYEFYEKAYQQYNEAINFCAFCKAIRSSYIHIFRITEDAPAEVYIGLGISLFLAKLPYSIPRLIFLDTEIMSLSLLEGYKNVVRTKTAREKEKILDQFIASAIKVITEIALSTESFEFNYSEKKPQLDLEESTLVEFVLESLRRYKEKYKEYFFEKARKIEIQDVSNQLLDFLAGSLSSVATREIKISIMSIDYPLTFNIISDDERCTIRVVFSWLEKRESTKINNEEECVLVYKSAYSKFSLDEINNAQAVEIKVRDFEKDEETEEEEEEEE